MTRTLILSLVMASFLFGCNREQVTIQKAVRLSADLPVITADTSFVIHRSYDIYYLGNLVMYKFEYDHDSLFNGQLVKHEERPVYFVFDADSMFGYPYYSVPDALMPQGRMSCDSIFRANAFSPFNFDSIFGNTKNDSVNTDATGNLVKVFAIDSTGEYPEPSVYYLYFSRKFEGVHENFFSKSGAKEKNLQLFKIRLVAKGHFYPQYNLMLPKREAVYEMSEISRYDTPTILKYFKKYKRELDH